ANSQYGRWEYIGQAHVDGGADHDRIVVENGGTFRSIQLGIKGGGIAFQRVLVHFENGQGFDAPVQDRIRVCGRTRPIDLPGDRRHIRSVEFWYGKADWRSSRPVVNLWGRR